MNRLGQTFFRYFPVSARDRRWGLWLTTAGESRIPAGSIYPPAAHPGGYHFDWSNGRTLREYQIVYISAGEGFLETQRNKSFKVRAGNAFILFPGVWHRYSPDTQTGWTEHWVGADGPIIRDLVKRGFFAVGKPPLRIKNEDLLLGAFSSIIDAIHGNQPALQQVMAGTTLYILSLLFSSQHDTQDSENRVAGAVHAAIRRMNESVGVADINSQKLARDLGVSYTWFRRTFTQHTGLSPHQYRLHLKLGRARTMLLDTSLTVKEIAYRTGFGSAYYFCRFFRQKTGSSPSQWRRQSNSVK
jgi:AraC-like DNA-binding protein